MKTNTLVIFVWFLSLTQLAAADPRVSEIRAECQAIRSALPTLKENEISLAGYSTERGVAKAYQDVKGNFRLIRAEHYGEMGKAIEEYYLRNGRLIFMYCEFHQYNVPFYLTPERAREIGSDSFDPRKTIIAEDRYYFHGSKMIRWLDKNKEEVTPDSVDFKRAAEEVLNSFNEFVSKIK